MLTTMIIVFLIGYLLIALEHPLKINKAGTTVLLDEQNAKMALSIAHRAYVLETGKVVMSGTGEELAKSSDVQKAYLGG